MKFKDSEFCYKAIAAVCHVLVKEQPRNEDFLQEAAMKAWDMEVREKAAPVVERVEAWAKERPVLSSDQLAGIVEAVLQNREVPGSYGCSQADAENLGKLARLLAGILMKTGRYIEFADIRSGNRKRKKQEEFGKIERGEQENPCIFLPALPDLPESARPWFERRLLRTSTRNRNRRAELRRKCAELWNEDVENYLRDFLLRYGVDEKDLPLALDYLCDKLSKSQVAEKHGLKPSVLSNRMTRMKNRIMGAIGKKYAADMSLKS